MKKRVLAVLLMLCMVITIMPVQALAAGDGEPLQQCVCTERCDAAAPNLKCPVCAVDPSQCAVEEAPQQCDCTERCDAAAPNLKCPVCAADPTRCAVEEAPQQCDCTERCDEAEPNLECPVCAADPTQCAVEETEEDLEPAQIFDALIEPSRAPRSAAKEIYLFLLKPGDYTISSTNSGDYYYLTHGGSVKSDTSFREGQAYISESDESEITQYVASWPMGMEYENPLKSSDPFERDSSISISSSTGKITYFKLIADGKTYSSNANESTDKKPYGIRWTKISYVGENNTMNYHVDGVLYDNSVPAQTIEDEGIYKTIDGFALDGNGEERTPDTFSFVLDKLGDNNKPAGTLNVPLQATVYAAEQNAELGLSYGGEDAGKVLTPGGYIIYEIEEAGSGYDSIRWEEPDALYFDVYSNGTIYWRPGSTDKTIANTLQKYNLTYHANAESDAVTGMPEINPVSDLKGYERVTIPDTVPQREGYRFLGWSTRSGATEPDEQYDPDETITITRNVDLYAVWKAVSYEKAPVLTDTVKFTPAAGGDQVTWTSGTNYTRIFDQDSTPSVEDFKAYAQKGTARLLYAVTIDGYNGFEFSVQDTLGPGYIVDYVGYADDVTSAPVDDQGVIKGTMNGDTATLYFLVTVTNVGAETPTTVTNIACVNSEPVTSAPVDVINTFEHVNLTKDVKKGGQSVNGDVVKVGDELTYTLTVTNDGTVALQNLVITDIFTGTGTLVLPSDEIATATGFTWTIDTLAVDEAKILTYTYTVTAEDQGQTLTNTATAGVAYDKGETKNPVESAGMTIAKQGAVESISEIAYTLTVENTGTADFRSFTVEDAKFPANVDAITVSISGGSSSSKITKTLTDGKLTVAVDGNFQVGATAEITYSYVPAGEDVNAAEITNTAKLTATSVNGTAVTDEATCTIPFVTGTLRITPVEMTSYIGGTSDYWGEGSGLATNSGFPAPHFIVEAVDGTQVPAGVTVTFHGKGMTDQGTPVAKKWKLEPYGGTGADQAVDENGKKIWDILGDNLQTRDGTCQYYEDADLSGDPVTADHLQDHHCVELYACIKSTGPSGANNTDLYAMDSNGNLYLLDAGVGKVFVREVSEGGEDMTYAASESTAATVDEALEDTAAAAKTTNNGATAGVVVPAGTKYTINGNENWELAGGDGNVSLLFDEVLAGTYELPENQDGHDMLTKAIEDNLDELDLLEDEDRAYESKYLDLVDHDDGNVWVKASNQIVVYWPYPDVITYDTADDYTFDLLHFTGMHRGYTSSGENDPAELIARAVANIDNHKGEPVNNDSLALLHEEITLTEYGIQFVVDQDQYGFSPFVLTWVEKDEDDDDDHDRPKPSKPSKPVEKPALERGDHFAYMVGYDDGTIRPNANITRAEVATIFFRLLTDDSREKYWSDQNPYSDISAGAWYNNAVSTMTRAGVLTGYDDGTFRPNANITRAEFAAIAARFLSDGYTGPDRFSDISGHWAAEYINRAARAGWIGGYGDSTFRPDQPITRAEAMTLINAVLERAPHEDYLLENMIVWPDNPESAWYYEAVQEATNSHNYKWREDRDYEEWTELLESRDWAALEQQWAQAGDAAGADIMP